MLYSCAEPAAEENPAATETLRTEYSENLSIVESTNGRRSYHFVTPLLEGYTLAREPYREFRKGIRITTYQDDSLSTVDAVLTANYAIYYEKRKLWEAKGNVVVEKSDGKTLYTQQLFWNALTKKIYSNVDSKIVQNQGRDVFIGEGFESDEGFKDWRFRRMKGRMEVDVTPGTGADSTDRARPAGASQSGRSGADRPAPARSGRPASSPSIRETPSAAPAPATQRMPDAVRPAPARTEPMREEPLRSSRLAEPLAEPVREMRSEARMDVSSAEPAREVSAAEGANR